MKKVLLVSTYPYSKTGRGMDVLTESFEECGWQTEHLVFPNVFYTVKKIKIFETKVKELYSRKALIPYIDSVMKWFPQFLFNIMVSYQKKKASFIIFSNYDFIVIESGKPLFLLDEIPKSTKVIYRQSDSVRYILGKNKFYIGLEDQIFDRAEKIVVVKERFKTMLNPVIQKKTEVILNGYSIPENIKLFNPYKDGSINAVYVGLMKLDFKTLQLLCVQNSKVNIHIFGSCLKKWEVVKLNKSKNFSFHGFQPREKYLSYIKFADIAIFPFKKTEGMKWTGFTTKYLNFMYFNLPIVSFLTGDKSEFDSMGVQFADTPTEFAKIVKDVLRKGEKGNAEIDFKFYSHEERKKEYMKFIDSL